MEEIIYAIVIKIIKNNTELVKKIHFWLVDDILVKIKIPAHTHTLTHTIEDNKNI